MEPDTVNVTQTLPWNRYFYRKLRESFPLMFIRKYSALLACDIFCPAMVTGSPASIVGCSTVLLWGSQAIPLLEDQLLHTSS